MALAISTETEVVSVKGDTIRFERGAVLVAELAARLLADAEPRDRIALMERLSEAGASAEVAYRSNSTVQLLEHRLGSLGAALNTELDAVLKAGGATVEHRLTATLRGFEKELANWTTRYIDPSSPLGLPALAAAQLRQATDEAIAQVRNLLDDGDEGSLARWANRVTKQVQESERNVLAQLVRRQTLADEGHQRGRNYEEALSAKLAQVGLAVGCLVERCSDNLGTKRMRQGDHLVTYEHSSVPVRVVIEAKSRSLEQRFSFEAVAKECRNARTNREAGAAVFVAESRDCLPDGVPFGQVGRCDFFVEFDPSGDDLGLVAALYLAKAAAIAVISSPSIAQVDRVAGRSLVEDIRERVERRNRIRAFHAGAIKAINGAAKALDEDTEAVLVCLSKLDALFIA